MEMNRSSIHSQKLQPILKTVLMDPNIARKYVVHMEELLLKKRGDIRNKDLVSLNKQCMGIYTEYDKQRRQHQSFVHSFLTDQSAKKRRKIELEDREKRFNFQKKWEVFRQKRELVFKDYYAIKEKRYRVKQLAILMGAISYITKFAKKYNTIKIKQVMKEVRNFSAFRA